MSKYFRATVISCGGDGVTGIFQLQLRGEQKLDARPGQFVTLQSLCADKIWWRPFSVYLEETDFFTVKFKIKGENTEHYSGLKPGDKISVIGPLGIPTPIGHKDKKIILVAGGIGIAGLMLLASKLKHSPAEIICLYGGKNQREITDESLLKSFGCRVKTVTEDQGLATDLLASELKQASPNVDSCIIACGPNAMLEKVAIMALTHGIPCQVVMETLMACGVGSCKGCVIPKVGGGNFHLCRDGPSLPAGMVDWEKLRRPSVIVPPERRKPAEEIKMRTVLVGQGGRKLILPSPIIVESGCLDEVAVTDGPVELACAGAIKSKGLTLEPRAGNPGPRICETPSGMLNSIGLENIGLKSFIKEQLPRLNGLGVKVIVNFSGYTVEEFLAIARALYRAGVKVFELNISCPNTKKGGEMFSSSREDTFEVTSKVRRVAPDVFLIVKLSPMASDIMDIAQVAEAGGADALSLFNTYLGMKIDLATRRPALGNIYGGMSGRAVMPMALRLVHLVCQHVSIPVIASTGITCGSDAAEYMVAGAQAVAIGSGLFSDPGAVPKIFYELREIVAGYGMGDIKELVGSLIL